MKKIINFFGSIFNFFDKILIMPITRFVYKISKKLSKPNKTFETWLSKPTTLLFVSLFIAITIFIVVDRKIITFSSQSAEVLKSQPVNVIYNSEQYVVEGLPETVDVTLIGSKAELYIARQSASDGVSVDLTGLKPGTHKVAIEYDQGLSGIEYNVNPSVANVTIYKKVSSSRSLTYDILNESALDSKLAINNVKLSLDEVTIRGAEYKIEQVATVRALIDLSKLTAKEVGTQKLEDIELKAYDSNGNVVDVDFVPEKLSADITVASPSKTVPLNFKPIGTLPTGKAISSYKFSRNNVDIYGDSETLENIDSLDVEVDISSLNNNTEFKAEIKKPIGIKSMSDDYVTVTLNITDASSSPVKFSIALTGLGLEDGLTASPVDKDNGFIQVEVKGAESVLSKISEEGITVYVDLTGKNIGTYTEDIKVKGTNPLVTYEVKRTKATVNVVKKN